MQVEDPEQDGGGDVIGKVAGHPHRPIARQRAEIGFQKVLLDERDVGGKLGTQRRDHVGIHFDRGQMGHPRREPQRQRAGPGTDLEEAIIGRRLDRVHQLVGPHSLQEVLTIMFLRPSSDCRRDGFPSPVPLSSISSICSSLRPK